MKIKNDFTIETAAEKLKKELSSHIKITVRKNVINNDKKWLDIDKDSFVGRLLYLSTKRYISENNNPSSLSAKYSSLMKGKTFLVYSSLCIKLLKAVCSILGI